MKKILITNPLKSILYALLLLFVITSCQKNTSDVVSPKTSTDDMSANLRANTLPTISLRITVSNFDANGVAYNIQNDGKGDYVNGVDYVQAVVDQYGTFAFNTIAANNTKTIGRRWVSYNFNNPVDGANTYRPSPSNSNNYHFSTGGTSFGTQPFIPLQNLGVNGNPSTECIYMGNGIANSTTNWRVSFHKGYEDVANSPTAFAVVTRTNISPAVWTITPVGACSPNSNVASLRSGDGTYLYGYYYIPFLFTLTAL